MNIKDKVVVKTAVMLAGLQMLAMVAASAAMAAECVDGWVRVGNDNEVTEFNGDCDILWVGSKGGTVSGSGNFREVLLMGNNNVVTVGNVDSANLMGNGNRLSSQNIRQVFFGGDQNTAKYQGSKPEGFLMGNDNKLESYTGNQPASVPMTDPDADPDGGPASAPAPSIASKNNNAPAIIPQQANSVETTYRGDALGDVSQMIHQTYEYNAGDFRAVKDHVYALYNDGTALRTPRIAYGDVGKQISREKAPQLWVKWRQSNGNLQLDANSDGNYTSFKGRIITLKPAQKGMRLSGNFSFVRTSGSMISGASTSRNSYSFTDDGRYSVSNSSFVGSGMSIGGSPTSVAIASCNSKGQSASVGHDNGVVPGGTVSGNGCGKANEGSYHIDGYSITLTADNGVTRRVGFYLLANGSVMIDSIGYWRK